MKSFLSAISFFICSLAFADAGQYRFGGFAQLSTKTEAKSVHFETEDVPGRIFKIQTFSRRHQPGQAICHVRVTEQDPEGRELTELILAKYQQGSPYFIEDCENGDSDREGNDHCLYRIAYGQGVTCQQLLNMETLNGKSRHWLSRSCEFQINGPCENDYEGPTRAANVPIPKPRMGTGN